MKKVSIIGAGFAGLSAASYLAKAGFSVDVYEKNELPGGRAQVFSTNGFTFDMGPSWYWMPDTFEKFFNDFDRSAKDYYKLIRLDPSYKVIFEDGEQLELPASLEAIYKIFERYEAGSGKRLKKYLKDARYKYETGMREFVEKPSLSFFEYADLRILKSALKLHMFSSVSKEVRKLFKHPKLIQILEFPVLFLGATAEETPALYSLMNYADIELGTWYPMGGMHEIAKAMADVAKNQGARLHFGAEVEEIIVEDNKVTALKIDNSIFSSDIVLAAADYHHVEQQLLPSKSRQYSKEYWENRVMAPSSLIFYIGVDRKINGLLHHNLFFDADFKEHSREIYKTKKWPQDPLFYVCCPSKTDESVAESGKENLFVLIPIAPGIEDTEEIRLSYFNRVLKRIEERIGENIRGNIIYKKSFCIRDFQETYNSFKGNAYGLANTLWQTAFLKPKMKSKVLKNLYFAGQLTTPGPGVPPSIISGRVAARTIEKYHRKS